MKNPWKELNLLKTKIMIHPLDLPHIEAYNKTVGKKRQFYIPSHIPPMPYSGNPQAPIFVLLANPGLSEKERKVSFKPDKSQLLFRQNNLIHKPGFTINHSIHTDQANPPEKSKYFLARTKRLIELTSAKKVAENIFFANFHPYHSKSWHNIAFTLPTQHYTFHLIRQAIKNKAIFVMSRNLTGWLTSVPELIDYPLKTFFNSSRGVHLSPRNIDSNFYKLILKKLE